MTHNKIQNRLLYLLNNFISARSTPKILSLKDEYTFQFLNFLIIDLCNSSAICRLRSETLAAQDKSKGRWFNMILLSAPISEDVSQKGFKPMNQVLIDIHQSIIVWIFAILNSLSRNTLKSKISKSLKSLNLHKSCHVESKIYLVRFAKYIVNILFL